MSPEPENVVGKRDIYHIFLTLGTVVSLAYSFYETFFVIDNSASDFLAAGMSFWIVTILGITFPITIFVGMLLFRLLKKNNVPRVIMVLGLPYVMGPILLTLSFVFFGGASALITMAFFLTQKIRDIMFDPMRVLKDIIIVFCSCFIALIGAFILDPVLQMNEQYVRVASDTLTHLPENVHYSVSPGLTVNTAALMFYLLIITMMLMDVSLNWVYKKMIPKEGTVLINGEVV